MFSFVFIRVHSWLNKFFPVALVQSLPIDMPQVPPRRDDVADKLL
jgi:hypothetical protein